jgi:hypothetical protein
VTRHGVAAFGQLMRGLVVAALLLVTAACGAYQFPGGGSSSTPADGLVSGRVLAVPCAPVEKVGSPCPGRPVPNLEIDYLVGASIAAKAVTDANGYYAVTLPPGSYDVKFKSFMRVINGPLTLSVSAGANLVANYLVDSGIRVPAPQA